MIPITTSSIQLLQHDLQGLTVCITHRSPVIAQIRLYHLTALRAGLGVFLRFILLADNVVQQCRVVIRHFFWCSPVRQNAVVGRNEQPVVFVKRTARVFVPFVIWIPNLVVCRCDSAVVKSPFRYFYSICICIAPFFKGACKIMAIFDGRKVRIDQFHSLSAIPVQDLVECQIDPTSSHFLIKMLGQLHVVRCSLCIEPNSVPVIKRLAGYAPFVGCFQLPETIVLLPKISGSFQIKKNCRDRFASNFIDPRNICLSCSWHANHQENNHGKH